MEQVAATQWTWRENLALTIYTSADSILDFKYVAMAQYLVQKPKFRDGCSSGEATEWESEFFSARRQLHRDERCGSSEEGEPTPAVMVDSTRSSLRILSHLVQEATM